MTVIVLSAITGAVITLGVFWAIYRVTGDDGRFRVLGGRAGWMSWPMLRTVILFFFSLVGIAWETVVGNGERPTLLILFGMMAGLPVFLNVDDKRTPKDPDPDPDPPKIKSTP